MTYQLPPLPYAENALEPHISAETLKYHYGKHHKTYVDKMNDGIKDKPELVDAPLEKIIRSVSGPLFNSSAQVWNHNFYWQCLSPKGGGEPTGALAKEIDAAFGSFADFRTKFSTTAETAFGSAWTWLVRDKAGTLAITTTSNADLPLMHDQTAILTCDVWEHAYYIDYRNVRKDYIAAFWNLVNWEFAAKNAATKA